MGHYRYFWSCSYCVECGEVAGLNAAKAAAREHHEVSGHPAIARKAYAGDNIKVVRFPALRSHYGSAFEAARGVGSIEEAF